MFNRVQRKLGEAGLKRLENATVGIVGLGSLGSWTEVILAMSGVGRFINIDPDTLEDHNVVRHAGDLRYSGRLKVEVGKDLIRKRNPLAQVSNVVGDARQHVSALAPANLVIVAGLGSEIAQSQMGELLREMGKPVIFGGLYERAVAGEVLFVNPFEGPCYSCFATLLRESGGGETPKVVHYGMEPDEVKAEPGLGGHVMRVATLVADWALQVLIADPAVLAPFPGNLAIVANEAYELGTDRSGKPIIIPPASSWWTNIERNPTCAICADEDSQPASSIDDLLKD